MDHHPGSIRVVARATAIIQKEPDLFLLTFHKEQGHYFLPGGKVKNRLGRDIAEVFAHPRHAGAYVERLFRESANRESAKGASVREIWEELLEMELVSKMSLKNARKTFRVIRCPDAIKILNPMSPQDPGALYQPRIDTENVILPCLMKLPPVWEKEIQLLWEKGDPRIWFASQGEIHHGLTVQSPPRQISPDVARILVRLGLISAYHGRSLRQSGSNIDSEDIDSEDSEGPHHVTVASA